eukprot:jgi/Ulvmu1/4714/UM002_0445.1
MVQKASESSGVVSRTSGQAGTSTRKGIHAVIRRLSDASDSRSKRSVSSHGVSPRVHSTGTGHSDTLSQASIHGGSGPFHPTVFQPRSHPDQQTGSAPQCALRQPDIAHILTDTVGSTHVPSKPDTAAHTSPQHGQSAWARSEMAAPTCAKACTTTRLPQAPASRAAPDALSSLAPRGSPEDADHQQLFIAAAERCPGFTAAETGEGTGVRGPTRQKQPFAITHAISAQAVPSRTEQPLQQNAVQRAPAEATDPNMITQDRLSMAPPVQAVTQAPAVAAPRSSAHQLPFQAHSRLLVPQTCGPQSAGTESGSFGAAGRSTTGSASPVEHKPMPRDGLHHSAQLDTGLAAAHPVPSPVSEHAVNASQSNVADSGGHASPAAVCWQSAQPDVCDAIPVSLHSASSCHAHPSSIPLPGTATPASFVSLANAEVPTLMTSPANTDEASVAQPEKESAGIACIGSAALSQLRPVEVPKLAAPVWQAPHARWPSAAAARQIQETAWSDAAAKSAVRHALHDAEQQGLTNTATHRHASAPAADGVETGMQGDSDAEAMDGSSFVELVREGETVKMGVLGAKGEAGQDMDASSPHHQAVAWLPEAHASTWHSAVSNATDHHLTAAETGAFFAEAEQDVMPTTSAATLAGAPLPPVPEGQPSFFGSTGFTAEMRAGRPWDAAALQDMPDLHAPPSHTNGDAHECFGSSVNMPAAPLQAPEAADSTRGSIGACEPHADETARSADSQKKGDSSPSMPQSGWGGGSVPCQVHAQLHAKVLTSTQVFPMYNAAAPEAGAVGVDPWQSEGQLHPPAADAGGGGCFDPIDCAEPLIATLSSDHDASRLSNVQPGTDIQFQGLQHADPQAGAWSGMAGGEEGSHSWEAPAADAAAYPDTSATQPYWWAEWGCWVSACGQYYYDEATGAWPPIYRTEASVAGRKDAPAWPAHQAWGADEGSRAGIGAVGNERAEAPLEGAGDGSFFESFARSQPEGGAAAAEHRQHSVHTGASSHGGPSIAADAQDWHAFKPAATPAWESKSAGQLAWPLAGPSTIAATGWEDAGHSAAAADAAGQGDSCFDSGGASFYTEPRATCFGADDPRHAWGNTVTRRSSGPANDNAATGSWCPPDAEMSTASHAAWGDQAVGSAAEQHLTKSPQAGLYAPAQSHPQQHAYQQQHAGPAVAPQGSHPPRSTRQAMCSNAGRPPCSFARFAFGGRCCVFQLPAAAPGYSETYTPSSGYTLSIMPSRSLPQVLAGVPPVAAPAKIGRGRNHSKDQAVPQAVAELKDWPGPMAQSGPPVKALAAAVEDRAVMAAQRGQDALALLWRVLLVMARHKGAVLDSMSKTGAPQGAILALVKQTLSGEGDLHTSCAEEAARLEAWTAHAHDPDVVSKVEALLMEGHRSAALAAATEAQAWPLALAIAQFSSPESLQAVLRELFDAALVPGSAMHVFSLLATQSYDGVATCLHQAAADAAPGPNSQQKQLGKLAQPSGPLLPANVPVSSNFGGRVGHPAGTPMMPLVPQLPGAADLPGPALQRESPGRPPHPQGRFHSTWRKSLLMLAANRAAGDMAALAALGDELWAVPGRHHKQFAHVCYVLAGKLLGSAADPNSSFVAPGVDHVAALAACGQPDALQRIELLAWCHMQCHGVPMYHIIPCYIMYASRLAEEGLIADALAYAGSAASLAIKARADRQLPVQLGNIHLVGSCAQDLHDRLKAHSAAVGASAARSGQSVVSRVGSFLDRSVMRMLGTDSPAPSPAEMSKSASAASLTSAAAAPRRQTGGHAWHASFDSESQTLATSLPVPNHSMNGVHPAAAHSGPRPASPPQHTSLMHSMHASHSHPGQHSLEAPDGVHAGPANPDSIQSSLSNGFTAASVQPKAPLQIHQQLTRNSLLSPSLPAHSGNAPVRAPQPSKSWLGGIAAKLLPGGSASSQIHDASGPPQHGGAPIPYVPMSRPPLQPSTTSYQPVRPQPSLHHPSTSPGYMQPGIYPARPAYPSMLAAPQAGGYHIHAGQPVHTHHTYLRKT